MLRVVPNIGLSGIAACAISAVDTGLWDWTARALQRPLASLLRRCRDAVPVYGSGGFTNYTNAQLRDQLGTWVDRDGCRMAKIKVGSDVADDPRRIGMARVTIGAAELFVDANGGYRVHEALHLLDACQDSPLRWFEEPVSADDAPGLRQVRATAAAGPEIGAANTPSRLTMPLGYWKRRPSTFCRPA